MSVHYRARAGAPLLARRPGTGLAPVEYAVAVDAYLAGATLSEASRRVYRISLAGLAWPLVGKRPPEGRQRRGAIPPQVPLALFDDGGAAGRLAAAIGIRAAMTDPRTLNRELSALRSAVGWWQDQGWIGQDPTAGLRQLPSPHPAAPPLTGSEVAAVFGASPSLREHALWQLIYDCAAPAAQVLALDAAQVEVPGVSARWGERSSQLLHWLLAGRRAGPVFVTSRRAPARAAGHDICPVTGRARMSYRRAAEIFTECTRPLDPAGRGWTLHQLRLAGRLPVRDAPAMS